MLIGSDVKVIADSSSTRTEWSLVRGREVLCHAITTGIKPYFQTRREISHIIRLELPSDFFKHRWGHVYFYGAGCDNEEHCSIVEASLVAQLKTPVSVESDLVGAARGLLLHDAGLACILGTGSNSCFYDGEKIVKRVRACGFILGDEGSGAALGRLLLSDILKGLAPKDITNAFFKETGATVEEIMTSVYNNPYANRNLRNYAMFLADHLSNNYVQRLVKHEIGRFFERNVMQYEHEGYPVCFVGAVASKFSEIVQQVAYKHRVNVKKIMSYSMPGLIVYHSAQ